MTTPAESVDDPLTAPAESLDDLWDAAFRASVFAQDKYLLYLPDGRVLERGRFNGFVPNVLPKADIRQHIRSELARAGRVQTRGHWMIPEPGLLIKDIGLIQLLASCRSIRSVACEGIFDPVERINYRVFRRALDGRIHDFENEVSVAYGRATDRVLAVCRYDMVESELDFLQIYGIQGTSLALGG